MAEEVQDDRQLIDLLKKLTRRNVLTWEKYLGAYNPITYVAPENYRSKVGNNLEVFVTLTPNNNFDYRISLTDGKTTCEVEGEQQARRELGRQVRDVVVGAQLNRAVGALDSDHNRELVAQTMGALEGQAAAQVPNRKMGQIDILPTDDDLEF